MSASDSSVTRGRARLSWRHARIAGIVFLSFAALILVVTRSWMYAIEIALGPFAGAVAREWQSCCAQNAWALAPYGIGILLAGFVVQLVVPPATLGLERIRRLVWWLTCIGWFAVGVLSYGHALE